MTLCLDPVEPLVAGIATEPLYARQRKESLIVRTLRGKEESLASAIRTRPVCKFRHTPSGSGNSISFRRSYNIGARARSTARMTRNKFPP